MQAFAVVWSRVRRKTAAWRGLRSPVRRTCRRPRPARIESVCARDLGRSQTVFMDRTCLEHPDGRNRSKTPRLYRRTRNTGRLAMRTAPPAHIYCAPSQECGGRLRSFPLPWRPNNLFPGSKERNMAVAHPKYKVAAVQAAPAFLDLEGSVEKASALIEEAGAAGARLIAFPETFIPGYPWWIWLGAPAWAIMRGFVSRYFDNSLSYDSPEADRLRAAAKRNKMFVALGLSERDGGSLYIAQWIIGPDGETVAKRRKLKPTHAERTVFGEGDGSHLAVHDLGDRPARRAVLLGAPAAAVEIRHVCPERAGSRRGLAELFALRPVRACARRRGEQCREQDLCGRGLVLRDRAMRDGFAGDDRRTLRHAGEASVPACRRRLCRDLWSRRRPARQAAAARQGRPCSTPTSISA